MTSPITPFNLKLEKEASKKKSSSKKKKEAKK